MARLPETGGPGTSAEPPANSPENQLPRNSRQLTLLAKRTAKKRKEEKKRGKGGPIRPTPLTSPQAPQAPAHPPQNSAALPPTSASHTMPWIYCSQDALQSARESRTALQAPRAPLYPAAPDSGCFRGGVGAQGVAAAEFTGISPFWVPVLLNLLNPHHLSEALLRMLCSTANPPVSASRSPGRCRCRLHNTA